LNKETSHRSHELKALGWNLEDISRYEELWEYSKRWGLINLEREDRQFLKKAEKLIPKLQPKKTSVKKSIEEKSYYLWLNFYLDKIKDFCKLNLSNNTVSVWEILLEEEMSILQKFRPVMGLPDTLKAKNLYKIRKELIKESFDKYDASNSKNLFDFNEILNSTEEKISKSWKSIILEDPDEGNNFPFLMKNNNLKFRATVNQKIENFMINNYPSLKK